MTSPPTLRADEGCQWTDTDRLDRLASDYGRVWRERSGTLVRWFVSLQSGTRSYISVRGALNALLDEDAARKNASHD